jgi:hypothetical protein
MIHLAQAVSTAESTSYFTGSVLWSVGYFVAGYLACRLELYLRNHSKKDK